MLFKMILLYFSDTEIHKLKLKFCFLVCDHKNLNIAFFSFCVKQSLQTLMIVIVDQNNTNIMIFIICIENVFLINMYTFTEMDTLTLIPLLPVALYLGLYYIMVMFRST